MGGGFSWGFGAEFTLPGKTPLSRFASVGFNYQQSQQTRFMIDNLYSRSYTAFFTYIKASYVSLSLYEPLLELSVPFRHAIENMPIENTSFTEQYVNDYILNYFGTTFVKEIMLGERRNLFVKYGI